MNGVSKLVLAIIVFYSNQFDKLSKKVELKKNVAYQYHNNNSIINLPSYFCG
jgi:hypothetical protein